YAYVLWFGLLIGALGTAFYMWRLYFLVFSGTARSQAAAHAHESPPSMTVPLVILALGATVGGLIGLPHLTKVHLPGLTHAFSEWLAPSVTHDWYEPTNASQHIGGHLSDTMTGELMGIALVVAIIGIVIAGWLYRRNRSFAPDSKVASWTAPTGSLHGVYEASL